MNHYRQGRFIQAEQELRNSDAIFKQSYEEGHPIIAKNRDVLALVLLARGNVEEALQLSKGAVDAMLVSEPAGIDILDLDAALDRLAQQDARKARLIELTYFAGLNAEEASAVMEISTAAVNRDLKLARAWLQRELAGIARREQ